MTSSPGARSSSAASVRRRVRHATPPETRGAPLRAFRRPPVRTYVSASLDATRRGDAVSRPRVGHRDAVRAIESHNAPLCPRATRARPFKKAGSNPRVHAGEVTKVPEPPSKWYDVLVTDGRTIQFQASALHAATSSRAATAAQYREGDGEESEEEVQADKQSHAQSLKRGTQVAIHRTENVQQRAPHLIGRIGTIKEVPQHPNTWFKVQFADRRVCTFRPSALRRVASGAQRSRKGSDDDEPQQKPRGRC